MVSSAYNKDVSNLNENDCIHILMQFIAMSSSCVMLIFYLFDLKRRHQNIRGMAAKAEKDPKAFKSFVG